MKNEQIIISVENTKIWWEEKIKEISGLERKAILSEKLRIYMYLEVFTLFITPITVWIPIGAGLFFLAHCVHLDIERKRGMKDKKAFELKINAHIEEWHGIISIFEEIFCENWDTKTVKSFESEYNLRNGLTGSELDDYEKEIKQKLTEYNENCYLHEIVQMYKERIAQWAHT